MAACLKWLELLQKSKNIVNWNGVINCTLSVCYDSMIDHQRALFDDSWESSFLFLWLPRVLAGQSQDKPLSYQFNSIISDSLSTVYNKYKSDVTNLNIWAILKALLIIVWTLATTWVTLKLVTKSSKIKIHR